MTNIFTRLGLEDPMTSGAHVIRCRETGEALANKLHGGTCVCKPGQCEMREMREKKGDYAHYNTDPSRTEDFDAVGFAIGMATGFPVSPRGITMGSILGSLLHPTERHASYDVTSATPTFGDDVQPAPPPAPIRSPDWNDNSTTAAPIDQPAPIPDPPPSFRASDPSPVTDPAPSYTAPERVPDAAPSYSEPARVPDAPTYTAPDPTPSYSAPDPTPSYSPDPSPSFGGGGGGDGT